MMQEVAVGAPAPEFCCKAVANGKIIDISSEKFKGQWVLLFFYPLDFTFVCPTEILEFSAQSSKFAEVNCSVLGASVDSEYAHLAWINMARSSQTLRSRKNSSRSKKASAK
eukprot:316590_1